MAKAESTASRGAAQLAHAALRKVVRELDKMAKGGLVVDAHQRALLTRWADRAQWLAVHSGEESPDLFTQEAAPRRKAKGEANDMDVPADRLPRGATR